MSHEKQETADTARCADVTDLEEAIDLELEAMREGRPRVTHRHVRRDGMFLELAWGPLERCVWR